MKYEKIIKWVLALLFVVGVILSVYGFIVGWPSDDQKWDTSLHFPVDLILWGAYAFAGCFVAAQCGDYSVAVPCEWVVAEAVLYHQVPAVFAGVARNTAHTGGAHRGNHHKNIFAHRPKVYHSLDEICKFVHGICN